MGGEKEQKLGLAQGSEPATTPWAGLALQGLLKHLISLGFLEAWYQVPALGRSQMESWPH